MAGSSNGETAMATPGDDSTLRSTPQPNSSFQAINRMSAGHNDSGRSSRVATAPGTPKADDSATATKQSAPAPPDALKASAQSDSYGTRSRRTGKERLNYAEDQDADFDFTSAATTTSYKKNAAASATNTQTSTDAKRTKESTQPATTNGAHSSANHQSIAKDPAPGATSASTNPKKRKAAGAATPTASTSMGGAAVSATNMRKQLPSSLPLARETNMLTFLRSKSCLNAKGELVADDGTKLNVNDHVYLVCEPPGEPYYLCRLMEFLHTDSDDPNSPVDSLRVNWYYRPRDVQRFNSDSRLVYATMHSDMCPLTSLRGLCTIKHRSEIDDLEAYRKERDTFYFVQVFDRFIRRWYECIPTSQIINVPEKVKKALDERWKFVAVETGRVKELTSAVKTCKRCTRYCASNESVDCAICKLSYHMNCVQPPLPKKPSRGFAWACAPCSRASERKLEAHLTPSASGEGTEAEVEEEEAAAPPEEALPPVSNQTTRAPSPSDSDMVIDDHPATQAEIALAQMWPMRYLGIHCRVEDALQYDDRAIYPRASSRLGPRHQANVNVWHGRPVELVKSAEIKKRYMKGGAKKEGKLSKETVAALEADRVEKAKRPKWVQDEPTGYVARGEDYPNSDPRCTAKMMFKMPDIDEKPKDDPSIAEAASREAERRLDLYLGRAKQLAKKIGVPPFGTNFLDKAVELYCMNYYNTEIALSKLSKVNRVTHLHEPVLSKVDLAKFEEGVAKYGSEHRLVRLHMKTDLPNADIVRFYYLWKKTPRGREIWGNYPGRKGKKRPDNDTASRLHEEVAHDGDDSAFDNDKASKRKRNFQCKFCETTHARQWRRAPGTAPGQTVMVEVKNGPKEKRERMLVALCFRCAGLWRKYAIQYEDVDEVAKKVTANAGRAWKRRVDEELLRELIAANEAVAHLPPLEPSAGDEPPKKKTKNEATPPVTEPARKKEKPPPPPKIPTPPPAPIIPTQPTWRALPCAVCHTGDKTISCNHCMLTVHQACYGVNDRDTQIVKPNGEVYWVCQQCQNDRNPQVSTDYSCCLCLTEETVIDMIDLPKSTHKKKNDRDREKERMEKELADTMRADYTNNQLTLHRPILPREPLKPTTGNNWVHVYCAVFTPEIRFSDAQALQVAEGFQMIPSAKYEAVCKLCKNKDHQNKIRNDKGACVNCHHCNTSFHVSCAFEAGYQFGFDVTPVKGSRKDYQPVATLNGETGALTAAIWCKEHTVKSIIHPIQEVAGESGRTALEVYAELYKQADLTLTGTVRKADQVQLTKSKAQHANAPSNAANRRESTATTAGARRGARNSTVAESRVEDADGATDVSSLRDGSVAPPDKRCAKCNIDVTPKWHLKPNDEPASAESADKRMTITLGEIADQQRDQPAGSGATAPNGTDANHGSDPLRPQQSIRFMAPGASGRAWDGMPERNAPRISEGASVDNAANGQQSSVPEQARTNGTDTANHTDKALEYLCHRCFVKRKMDPTPPPPSPPPRREPSPPKSYPVQLDWNGQAAPQRPPHPPSPWDEPSRQHPPPPHMAQGPPPPPHMSGMGPGPSFMHHQPPPPPHQNHGFPPTYHHQPNGYPGPHVPPHASYGGYPPQPSPNGVFHPGHRPPPMNGFPPPGQPMPNGIGSPHGSQMQPPGFPGPHPHQQYGPRGRESPFPPHQSHLPPLGGPLYGSPNSHFPHPDAQQQVHQQPQPPSTSAPVQPSPQTAHARASSQSVQPATPHEGQSNGPTATSGASASPTYNQDQRDRVKVLLEAGRDEEFIEKDTGVSDRTIRRWKMELERTGRIGKPPESRTGRHRVLNAEVETALFEHVKDKPELSVDDMLWWLYDTYKIVVGTRTIRRVFERKGEAGNRFKKSKQAAATESASDAQPGDLSQAPIPQANEQYQSPYAPIADMTTHQNNAELTLAQALTGANYPPPPPAPLELDMGMELPPEEEEEEEEDEETLQLQLQQIELQRREVELKLKMRRLQQGKNSHTPGSAARKSSSASTPSTLYKPSVHTGNSPPKRDSRSKKKIEESRRRTAERQERMLRDLERRSRRREHLTAEWVQSKDVWPLRAQGALAELMHQYGYYTFNQNNVETFEAMYRELYLLVDLSKNDWDPNVHDDMLRERMKRKMGQLRTKMQKTGEIIGRADGYAGWQKADDYTGEQAGHILGDDAHDPQDDGIDPHHDPAMQVAHASMQAQAQAQAQAGAQQQQQQQSVAPQPEEQMHYEPVPDPNQMGAPHGQPIYGNPPMMHHQQAPPYPMMDSHHQNMLPYGQLPPGHENGMVM